MTLASISTLCNTHTQKQLHFSFLTIYDKIKRDTHYSDKLTRTSLSKGPLHQLIYLNKHKTKDHYFLLTCFQIHIQLTIDNQNFYQENK